MKIIENAIGSDVLDEFNKNRTSKAFCYCLIFHLSDLEVSLEKRDRELIQNFIKNEFVDRSGLIFMMNSSDIVFFITHLNTQVIEKVRESLSYCLMDVLSETQATDINRYISQYDLGISYAECSLTLKTLAEKRKNVDADLGVEEDESLQVTDVLRKDPMFLLVALKKSYNKDIFVPLAQARPKRARKVVLIIEDQIFSQKILRNCIGPNYTIEVAGDSITGLKMYLKVVPDMVFLDWHLPDINGIEFLKQIKKVDPYAYVVMSTANSTSTCVNEALSNGAKGYITKPYNKEKVHKNLNAYLQR